jgi:spermidine synthase
MAVVWEKRRDGVHYQVRSAGKTLRLYTNGVLHTQFNPSRLLTGSVWDLLLLGALFSPPLQLRRVLVLGVGGGAVIRQLLALFPQVQITGVELNPVHLQVARRHFGLHDARVTLHAENAITWLALYDGEPFDLVIDDLFGECDGLPCRAVSADADWFDMLATHLQPDGALVMNFAGATEVRRSDWGKGGTSVRRFPYAVSLSTPTCENRVVTFLARAVSVAGLSAAVAAQPLLKPAHLRYRARSLRAGTP